MVEAQFLDQNFRPSSSALEAFTPLGDKDRASKFIASYRFALDRDCPQAEKTSLRDLNLVIRRDIYRVSFYRAISNRHHINYIAQEIAELLGIQYECYLKLSKQYQEMIRFVLSQILLGGGIAGVENKEIVVEWGSNSLRGNLGYDRPQNPRKSKTIIEEIRVSLFPVFNLCEDSDEL